ncbi:MAG: biotin--[acetyl-CoA-carboxylase] ligase [Anaerolineaceae bacterium]|jgi:BirA family biotin operon repressor/biotin-[acetyl-CoA-carboxylase] ligase|nr:biotin--[acetyl-CoA-carboxylase] ligase [Anaerolineaceae bacterium]
MEPEALSRLPVPAHRYYASVTSTNDLALAWAASGAPDGALVVADTQTAGRGRMSRRWITPPGSALAFSLVLRPTAQELAKPALFSPLGGLALSIALESRFNLHPAIKWPNDVLLDGRKTAGVLAESTWQNGKPQAIILGIGVNVGLASAPPADQVQFPATCIEAAAGKPVDRFDLLAALLTALFTWREQLPTPAFLQAWEKRLAFVGEQVQLIQPDQQTITGRLTGITPQGGLCLTLPDGTQTSFAAGDVTLRRIGKNPVQ